MATRETTCPNCKETVHVDSKRCLCGWCFHQWTMDWEMSPQEFWASNSTPKAQKVIKKLAIATGLDFKALHILFNTEWNLDGREGTWIQDAVVPPEDLAYAKKQGVMRGDRRLKHDDVISKIIAARDAIDRRTIAQAFASSLLTRRLDHRSVLGSYAHALHLSKHAHRAAKGSSEKDCAHCGLMPTQTISANHNTFRRLMWAGNVIQGDLGYVLCDLESFSPAGVTCQDAAAETLGKVFDAIRALPKMAQLSDLEKSLTGLFPSDKRERQVLLEILGSAGILKPRDFPSRHERWIPPSELPEPSHFYKKEWRSPVNCWSGADGVNEEAVEFWFGDL